MALLSPSLPSRHGRPPSRAEEGSRAFKAFIYAWISFNGWASCCVDREEDAVIIKALCAEPSLVETFNDIVRNDVAVERELVRFHDLWPIFRASDVRDVEAPAGPRSARVERYLHAVPDAVRAPTCHMRHPDGAPADWGHTLWALYRVRCNLFHGTKSSYGEEDRMIVGAAAGVLVPLTRRLVLGK